MNFLHKNKAAPVNTSSSNLLANPIWNNATQMNDNLLNHGSQKLVSQPLFNAQGVQAAPLSTISAAPLSFNNSFSSFSGSRQYRSAGQYRPIRLRTRNWGQRTEFGWTGFNRSHYYETASWEPKNFVLEELRSQRNLSRGLQSTSISPLPIAAAPLPIAAAPIQAAPLKHVKSARGHHHGLRKKRAQAVLPVQPLSGGPAIATLSQPAILPMQQQLPLQQQWSSQKSMLQTRSIETLPVQQLQENRQTIVRPAIVEETFRTDKVIEVQPILHREIEQPIINHIVKHQTEAPAPSRGGVVRMAPVVQETVATRVIDEIQPIVHREVAQIQKERVVEEMYENISAPAQHTQSVQYERDILPSTAPVQAPILRAAPTTTPTMLEKINAPATHTTTSLAPRVEETIRTDRLVEVMPIIHRTIEQEQINHIEKHITEAAAVNRGGVVRNAPIVQETVHTRVIDEIQPVVHREKALLEVERVQEDLYEAQVAPAIHRNEVLYENSASLTAAPLVAPLVAPLASSSTLRAPATLAEAPMTATVPITKVAQPIAPINTFGTASM